MIPIFHQTPKELSHARITDLADPSYNDSIAGGVYTLPLNGLTFTRRDLLILLEPLVLSNALTPFKEDIVLTPIRPCTLVCGCMKCY